jgi:hypothetical protein
MTYMLDARQIIVVYDFIHLGPSVYILTHFTTERILATDECGLGVLNMTVLVPLVSIGEKMEYNGVQH